jgi:hypothetical protein
MELEQDFLVWMEQGFSPAFCTHFLTAALAAEGHPKTSGAKARVSKAGFNAALKRCSTLFPYLSNPICPLA